jgi:hypothetical protein
MKTSTHYRALGSTVLTLFLMMILTAGCNAGKKEEVKQAFLDLQKEISDFNTDAIVAALDQESINYIKQLVAISGEDDYDTALALGEQNNYDLTTLMLYENIKSVAQLSQDSTEESKMDVSKAVFIAAFSEIGMLRFRTVKSIEFREVESINGEQATLLAAVPTGDGKHFIVSKYRFNFEGDEWKLNLLSTFTMQENLLRQLHRRSRKDKVTFIQDIVETPPDEVEFRYKSTH